MNFLKDKKGFTLIELIVSAGIITLIFAYTLANFRGAEQNDMKLALQKVISDIREVQTMALAGKVYEEVTPNIYPAGGYGLAFTKASNNYEIFADLNSNVYPDVAEDEVADLFSRSMLGKNIVSNVYYSNELNPSNPSLTSEAFDASDWIEVNFAALSFSSVDGQIKIIDSPDSDPSATAKYVGILITTTASSNQAYLYISRETGLISSGIIN